MIDMIDINQIINREIRKAYMCGRYELAKEVTEIAGSGKDISEWNKSRENAIQHCYDVQEEYLRNLIGE